MAEAMEALVPVPAGTLTDEDYEKLLDAMPSLTEVAKPIVVEPEKSVDPIVVAEPVVAAPKPRRVCGECNHPDNNSVGKIKLGEMIEIERDGMKLRAIKPICNVCFEKKPPQERAKVRKIGFLISEVGVENGKVYARRDAVEYWTAFKAGEAESLQARRDKYGTILCGVPGCRLCHDDEPAVRFTIVKNAEGHREIAGICREQFDTLIKVGVANIRLFNYEGAVAELVRRNREAGKNAPPPKQPELAPIAAESVPARELTRAEREARRWERRRKLALAVGNTRFGTGKKHKGGQKGSNGGGKKR